MRSYRASLAALLLLTSDPAAAPGAIIASWRVNPISPAAIAAHPELANALSVSMLVTLTGNSLWDRAGLDLNPLLPGVTYFDPQHPVPPPPVNPFGTYVYGTVFGPLSPGPPQTGDGGFNAVWGTIPASGPAGGSNLEIARLTMLNVVPGLTPIPPENGFVRASDAPAIDVSLPPIPVAVVPEPSAGWLSVVMLWCARRVRVP